MNIEAFGFADQRLFYLISWNFELFNYFYVYHNKNFNWLSKSEIWLLFKPRCSPRFFLLQFLALI